MNKVGFTPHLLREQDKIWPVSFKKGAGFTLIETLITITILVLVLGAIYGVYVLSQKTYQEGERLSEITQNSRVILERLTREIRQAREIVTELPEEELGATSTIMFEDGHILEPYHYIRYFNDDNLIKREVIGFYFSGDVGETLVPWDAEPPSGQILTTQTLEEAQIIGEYVVNLKFFGSELVQITLALKKKNTFLQLSSEVFGRNF